MNTPESAVKVTHNGRTATAEVSEWTDANGWTCTADYVHEYWRKAVQPLRLTWSCTVPREPAPIMMEICGASRAEIERLLRAVLVETEV